MSMHDLKYSALSHVRFKAAGPIYKGHFALGRSFFFVIGKVQNSLQTSN